MFFQDQPTGLLVDVGAADGFWNSNSIGLLKRPGWRGVLIEPEPMQYAQLVTRYQGHPGVTCLHCAVGKVEGKRTLFCSGQVSTLDPIARASAEVQHHVAFTTTQVPVYTLTHVLEQTGIQSPIDFLSIDTEGTNYEAWLTLDIAKFSPRLVCIEGTGYAMHGYKQLCRMVGNTFYLREDQCPQL